MEWISVEDAKDIDFDKEVFGFDGKSNYVVWLNEIVEMSSGKEFRFVDVLGDRVYGITHIMIPEPPKQ